MDSFLLLCIFGRTSNYFEKYISLQGSHIDFVGFVIVVCHFTTHIYSHSFWK